MVTKKIGFILIAAALASAFAASAFAEGTQLKADVPFAFYAGNEKLPAGTYDFIVDDPSVPDLLVIETPSRVRHELVLTNAEQDKPGAVERSELVFDRSGNDHFLSVIRIQGMDEERAVPKGELHRERLSAAMSHDHVTVTLRKKG